jgi:hypothetical protein
VCVCVQITLVDTPGVLSGEKQRIDRSYDFINVVEWFASRCDVILLLFDPHKLDISDEFKAAISSLRGHDDKASGPLLALSSPVRAPVHGPTWRGVQSSEPCQTTRASGVAPCEGCVGCVSSHPTRCPLDHPWRSFHLKAL